MHPPVSPYNPPPNEGLDLVHVEECLLVVNKPAGLLSVPGRGEGKEDCMASRVQAEFPDALIVHRLDMGTSGLLVFARSKDMLRKLGWLFESRQVEKRYIALLDGLLGSDAGTVDLPLTTDWPNRPIQKVDFEIGKQALTHYRLLGHDLARKISRVELEPKTGRSHQLRVHMASLGHPIQGDDFYGAGLTAEAPRLMLHAEVLAFAHPVTGEALRFERKAEF